MRGQPSIPGMSDGTGSPFLGDHVVGQRVVVRRLLPGETGPTGGPAFTDVLGDCIAWDPCVVVTASGERVEIPVDLIVSGKPVPPRPSVRMRATVAECEVHVAGLWPAVVTDDVAGWTLRHSPTVGRRRANSCLAVVEPSVPLPDALTRVGQRYGALGRTPLLHVEVGSQLERALLDLGCTPAGGEADLLLGSVARVRRALGRPARAAELESTGPRATASVGLGCDPVAEGRATATNDWLGLHDLEVDPSHRRQGLARSVLAALLDFGAEQGARTAWLHVEADNPAALALYESAGFTVHHRMEYLTLPR